MSVATAPTAAAVAPLGRMLVQETRARLVGRLRNPAFSVLSLGLPVMFYAFFNGIYGSQPAGHGVKFGTWILVSYATYAMGNVMVYNFGMGLANDRGRKLDLLQRATPLPPAVAFLAYVISALAFGLLALLVLFAYATVVGGVRLGAGTWLDLMWRLLLGAFPMIGLGMALGYGSSPNAAPALVNAIYLPMLFLSGIFVPLSQLPSAARTVGSWLPAYHYAQLGWETIGLNDERTLVALAWLAGWTVVLFGLALRLYRLDQDKKFS
jgi:ABC-2 type transport system permease protein